MLVCVSGVEESAIQAFEFADACFYDAAPVVGSGSVELAHEVSEEASVNAFFDRDNASDAMLFQ